MQMRAQINNKNLSWVVSATLLLAALCTVVFMAFSPSVTPTAHAGYWTDKIIGFSNTLDSVEDSVYGAAKNTIDTIKDPIGSALDATLGSLFAWIGKLIFWLASLFFGVAAFLLDASIAQSLDSDMIKSLTTINDGWGIVRDVCNMFFIFILLYIAIATILQATTFNWKKTLGNLIIAALLINFSLFFTKVIIDVSNVFAMTFYNSMQTDIDGTTYYGPSVILKEGLNLETTFNSIDEQKAIGLDNRIELDNMTRGIIWIFGAIFQMIAGFVFLAGAFIFIKRTIAFIFLMILSPIGFIGFVLPYTKKFSDMWWKGITENAVIAPVFLFMLYLVCGIVRSGGLASMNNSDQTALAVAFTGESSNYVIILHFIILIGLMWGALVVAQAVSATTASSSIRFAGKMTGGMLAGTAMAGRQVGGRAGRMVSESELVKRGATSRSGIIRAGSRMALQGGDAAAKSSWDVRKTKVGDAAISGTLNYASSVGKTGSIDVGLAKERGKGGMTGARAAQDEKMARSRQNLGNIIAKDWEGDPRMMERTMMEKEMVEKEVKDEKTGKMVNKMVATGKMVTVQKKDEKTGKMVDVKEKVSARQAYVEQLEKQAEKPKKGEVLKRMGIPYGRRDRQAIKKGAEYAKKGDKETKETMMAERTSMLENQLKSAKDTTEKAEIVSNIGGNDLINIDPDVLSGKDVAPHLSARQARKIIEDKRTNLSDKHFENWEKNLEKKVGDAKIIGDEREKAQGALSYIKGSGLQHTKGGAGYIKKETESSNIITNVSDNELKTQFNEKLQKKGNS